MKKECKKCGSTIEFSKVLGYIKIICPNCNIEMVKVKQNG